ncbi:MAG: hypothetical protein ACKVP7_06815 [Hyphomicrobiaceae bacterium]
MAVRKAGQRGLKLCSILLNLLPAYVLIATSRSLLLGGHVRGSAPYFLSISVVSLLFLWLSYAHAAASTAPKR